MSVKVKLQQIIEFCDDDKGNYGKWSKLTDAQKKGLKSVAQEALSYINQLEKEISIECAKTYAEEHADTVRVPISPKKT